jgi:hypothetical protein
MILIMESDSMLTYKIDSANYSDGTPFGKGLKELPIDWTEQEYNLNFVSIGRSAILAYTDNSGKCLRTSVIQGILISDNTVILQTMNTVYYLKPVGE